MNRASNLDPSPTLGSWLPGLLRCHEGLISFHHAILAPSMKRFFLIFVEIPMVFYFNGFSLSNPHDRIRKACRSRAAPNPRRDTLQKISRLIRIILQNS
jgi:hypothetical protein